MHANGRGAALRSGEVDASRTTIPAAEQESGRRGIAWCLLTALR